jgi:signal transduction histidine kinase
LVKNSYDANASEVTIKFIDVEYISNNSKIVIEDNGIGMSFEDVRDKWMVIGTDNKRRNTYSPPPCKRRVVGKKGVGRFAVDKLGSHMQLSTTKIGNNKRTVLSNDWTIYEQEYIKQETNKSSLLFTEIGNQYTIEDCNSSEHGTKIVISGLRDFWTESDINRAFKELSKLISPVEKQQTCPFNIRIMANDYEKFKDIYIKNETINHATLTCSLSYDIINNTQETLQYNETSNVLEKVSVPIEPMGPIEFTAYYFDREAKAKFKKGTTEEKIDGIKIYRDGIITTPFAEYNEHLDKRRDILGIDKRRWSSFFDRISSRDIIGYVNITDENNPNIIEATNRQDFLDNDAYISLKNFIFKQIIEIEKYINHIKNFERENTKSGLKVVKDELAGFTEIVKEIKRIAPESLQKEIKRLETVTKQVQVDLNKGIKAYNDLEKEKTRQEDLFMSLMSLQEYASELAHLVRTALSKVMSYAKFIKDKFPDPKYNEYYKFYSEDIYHEMMNLDKAIDFMLSYARSDIQFEEFSIKSLLHSLFYDFYSRIFEREQIDIIFNCNSDVSIVHNKKFFEDIIINLITNSIKALKNTEHKKIRCSLDVHETNFTITFSDNGIGIPAKNKNKIFDIYFTTTADSGGAGIGLYTVKKRLQALNGSIQLISPEYISSGTSFFLTIPFNNHKP